MNRLMAEAVIARAEQGQRVLVLDRDMRDVAAHFDDAEGVDITARLAAIRVHGKLGLKFEGGGRVDFRVYRGVRGLAPDVVLAYNEPRLTVAEHEALESIRAREIMRADD